MCFINFTITSNIFQIVKAIRSVTLHWKHENIAALKKPQSNINLDKEECIMTTTVINPKTCPGSHLEILMLYIHPGSLSVPVERLQDFPVMAHHHTGSLFFCLWVRNVNVLTPEVNLSSSQSESSFSFLAWKEREVCSVAASWLKIP